jgi:hypothetical protein
MTVCPAVRDAIRQLPVPCLAGSTYALCDTYLPLAGLQQKCASFMAEGETFPFLDITSSRAGTKCDHESEIAINDEDLEEEEMEEIDTQGRGLQEQDIVLRGWVFLCSEFGVSKDDDVGFLLEIVSYVKDANPDGLGPARCRALSRLYCEIEERCSASTEAASVRDIVRCFFRDIDGIAIPATTGSSTEVGWVNSDACVWDDASPSTRRSGYCVRRIYEELLGGVALDADHALVMFFQQTLGL